MSEITIRDLVRETLRRTGLVEPVLPDYKVIDEVSAELVRQLRLWGFAIHDTGNCIRLPDPPGQPMTDEEMTMVGIR